MFKAVDLIIQFRFFDPATVRDQLWESQNAMIPDDEFANHVDPFHAECRAYGRIEEFYRERPPKNEYDVIAVPCYGYLHASQAHEDFISKKFGIKNWDRPKEVHSGKLTKQPIRCLVKRLVETTLPFNTKERPVKRMVADLKALLGIEVYQRDIFARNYVGGLLVDFSSALTAPHCILRVLSDQLREVEMTEDLSLFDQMIEEEGIKTKVLAAPYAKTDRELRPRNKTMGCVKHSSSRYVH